MSQTVRIEPVTGALGAEIGGVDLSQDISNSTFAAIHQAFLAHEVIFFRNQKITPDQQKAFGRRFGTLNIHPYVKGMDDHPEVMEIIKEPTDKLNFGGGWHSDTSFMKEPALGSVLYALEIPPFGGDTLFASQTKAFESLSPGMQRLCESLTAIHTAKAEYGRQGHSSSTRASMAINQAEKNEVPAYEHPVVRTHPETGRKALYINPAFTERFSGMTRTESKPLLEFLYAHGTREEFTCRFRWSQGAVAFWDNRSVQHYALNDYQGHKRHMRRVTIEGNRPH